MEQKKVKTMTNEQPHWSMCVASDREQKKSRAMMEQLQGGLQHRGLAIMEDHKCEVCEVLR